MYYETKSIIDRFDHYLLDKHKPAIRALAILNLVRRSMTELITSPHLQDSLSHMTISTDSPDSGACSKTTDSPSPLPNEPEDSSTGNAHSKHHHSYNPRAEESDYNDNKTPEIGDIHGDKVYNNID
jgi:hypothetical protein